jgi:hypothetical protein
MGRACESFLVVAWSAWRQNRGCRNEDEEPSATKHESPSNGPSSHSLSRSGNNPNRANCFAMFLGSLLTPGHNAH